MIVEDNDVTKLKIRIPTPKVDNDDEEKSKVKKINWFIYLLYCSCCSDKFCTSQ